MARHILHDVFLQQTFDLLRNISTLDNQPLVTINGSLGTQLGKHERHDVLKLTVHELTDRGKVGPHRLSGANTNHLSVVVSAS